jgi:DNA-binding MarR family transcriptional regulator
MRFPWEVAHRRILAGLHEHGFTDLSAPHVSVLLYPGPEGLRPSELAGRRGMTKQAVNYLLGELERMGYLERRADPDDRRSRRIALTARGESLRPVIRESMQQLEAEWAKLLGRDRLEQLRELLTELAALAGEP